MDVNFKPVGRFLAALTITCGMVIAATDARSFGDAGRVAEVQSAPMAIETVAALPAPLVAAADREYMSASGEGRFAPDGQLIGGR